MVRLCVAVVALPVFLTAGCDDPTLPRPDKPAPAHEARKRATVVEYIDSEAFDGLLEAAINRQDSIIVVQTASTKPDWQGRLNAWIAAWNEGGRVQKNEGLLLSAVQIAKVSFAANASTVSVIELPPDTAKETRKLIQGEIDRIERLARDGVGWWKDEKKKSKRIDLLKPYLFIFEKDAANNYQIIFFK